MEKIIELIKNANSISILPHIHADGDAIGSSLAMRQAMRKIGKSAEIYAEEKLESRLKFLDDGIIVYEGEAAECDLCIALDCGDIERIGKRIAVMDLAQCVVNIDHHKTNTFFGDAAYVEASASATGEILFKMFRQMEIELDEGTAKYLYAAICSDTGNFAYSNVSPDTFKIAAELIGYNINHAEISRQLFDCVDLNSELMKAELTSKIHSYYEGRLRIVAADEEIAEKYGLKAYDISDLVNLPRRIRGTEVAVSLKAADGKVRVSLRSNSNADVASIAEQFGGGGHIKAAGCTIDTESLEEAERLIVGVCKGAL